MKKRCFFVCTVIYFLLVMTSCKTVQETWKTDISNIEKDIFASRKDGIIIFTNSDSNDICKKMAKDVFTETFFSEAGKDFLLYNVDIVRDESLMPAKQLEKNYVIFADYSIFDVPHICMLNKYGDAYHSSLIPADIESSKTFVQYLKDLKKKGDQLATRREKIDSVQGVDKIKAIEEFFNSTFFVNTAKYNKLFDDGINSDPENKTGLSSKFLMAKKQLEIDKLLTQKKYDDVIAVFEDIINSKILKPEEEQGVLSNIAYIAAMSKSYTPEKIIKILERALNAAPNSARANDIKADIAHLKSKLK